MDFRIVIGLIFGLFQIKLVVNGACTWPSQLMTSTWRDSSRGDLEFTTTTMSGYTFQVNANVSVTNWECLAVDTFDTDGRVLMLTSSPFEVFFTNYYAYLCITMTRLTDASFRYYINHPISPNLMNNERLFIYPVNTLTDAGTICSDSAGAAGAEYQVLIRSGVETSAKINCPWSLLGRYGYTHQSKTGVSTCDSSTSELDMCTDTTQVTFDYAACDTKVAFSNSDTVWCVDNVAIGDNNYVMTYNGNDASSAINDGTIYRYSCIAMAPNGSHASVSPKHCQQGQTPDQIPTTPSGTNVGGLLTLTPPTETCPTCPELSNPARGTVSIATSGAVTTASYVCDTGYTLSGDASRTCQADMTWSLSEPFCNCAVPPSVANGDVTISSDGTTASYTCDVGFTLSGLGSRNCLVSNATWEGNDPNCVKCDALADASGRSFTQSTNGTVTSAMYTCASGYTLNGTSSITCTPSGSWDNQQPTCVACASLTNPQSGTVTITTDGSTSTATYACATGYTLDGSLTRTCLSTGDWTNTQPTCACNKPSVPSNGALVSNGVTATYTCSINYTLNGDVTRTCQSDGSGWSGSDPTCVLCAPLSTVAGGDVTLSTTGTVTSAAYTCTVGYSLDGVSSLTCSPTGTWSSTPPSCVLCPTLISPSSGTVSLSTSGTKTSAIYSCTSGYVINGNTVRLCNSDGTWSLTEPTCTCTAPPSPLNGQLTADGSVATYTCNLGYSLNGVSSRTCGTDGSGWSSTDPTCSTCSTLTSPTGGSVSLTTDGINTMAAFTCSQGYTLNGVTPITCRSDGSWDFTQPTCAKCPDLTAPSSGTMILSTSGTTSTASFSCASGYYISGAQTLTCGSDGTWDNAQPMCKCNFPSTPSNGAVSVSDGASGTIATYTCVTGYTLNGLSSRTCQTDGTGWEGSDPACVICQTVALPSSGSISLSTNGTHTSVTFTCDLGTSLLGEQSLVCQSSGQLDGAVPSCVQCPSLSDPSSGSVSMTTDGLTTRAVFTCVSGYTLIDSSATLTCIAASGTWDVPSPSCVCESPPALVNGQYDRTPSTSTVVTYTCNTGYVLIGSETRNCPTNGTGWDGIEPSCGRCNDLASPAGGIIQLTSSGITTSANYSCLVGYTLTGTSTIDCQTDQTWSHDPPVCVQCQPLDDPFSGDVTFSTDGHTTLASFTCDPGYALVGTISRLCATDGTWDFATPVCECEDPVSPTDGAVNADGTTANYSCNLGHTLSGASVRTCRLDGTGWSHTDPSCVACAPLANPAGGSYTLTTSGSQTFGYLSCTVGYSLNGEPNIQCLPSGSWEIHHSCLQCPILAVPDSGNFTLASSGMVTVATFSCQTGYDLIGDVTSNCGASGVWDSSPPSCVCKSPNSINNGLMTHDGVTATYTCDVGYTIDGPSRRTCGDDGSGWSGADPSCVACATLTPPTGGSVALSTDTIQTQASYTCDAGYTLNGAQTITCRSDGTWDFSEPQCVHCDALDNPASGTVTMSTNGFVTTASFMCSAGYYINGQLSVTCRTDGQWSDSPPTCKCNFPTKPAFGTVAVTDETVATYTCIQGYSINGPSERYCNADGSGWNDTDPVCVLCDTITPGIAQQYTLSTNSTNTLVQYTCSVNYTLHGESVHMCQSDGTWSGVVPICVPCEVIYAPDSGDVVISSDGIETSATFSCKTGYGLNSTGSATCLTSGSWSVPEPDCLCLDPDNVQNGFVVVTSTAGQQIANYTCAEDYELIGPSQRVCLNQGLGWNGTQPRCEPIDAAIPAASASTDESSLSLHVGILAVILFIIVCLVVAVIVCSYFRFRKDRQKVSATFDEGETPEPDVGNTKFQSSKDIDNGSAFLIGKAIEKKNKFNVGSLKPSETPMDIQDHKLPPLKAVVKKPPLPTHLLGSPEHKPLPSIAPEPPQSHSIERKARKRPKTKARREHKKTPKSTSAPSPRTSTPTEKPFRTDTPNMLSAVEFDYIKPVYCHSPSQSRPTTASTAKASNVSVSLD